MPIDKLEAVFKKAINKDMSGEDIERMTRAVAHGVAKGVNADEVVQYTEKVLNGGIKGEDVTISIYRWVGNKMKK